MVRCGSFPLLSATHSVFSIWTDLKRSEKIPGAPVWRWGEWIWLTGLSGLHRNSPQGLNISSIRPGAHHSSKAAFGKSAFAETCSDLLYFVIDMTGAHQSSKKQKYFRARFGTCNEENAFFLKRAKMCSKAFLIFARLMCASRIFNKRKHVLAKALFPKAALLDWSAPGLRVFDQIRDPKIPKPLRPHIWILVKFGGPS